MLKGYRQFKGESRAIQEIDFGNITKQLQTDYLHRYVQIEIHQVS